MTKNNVFSIFGLLTTAVFFIVGCNASTSPTTGTTTTEGSMVATVNGKAWSSTVVPLEITGGAKATRSSSGIVTVTGVQLEDQTEITLVMPNPSVGQIPLVTSGSLAEYSNGVPDTSTAYISIPSLTNFNPGSISISKFDTVAGTISGTFNFIGRKSHNLADTVNITGGSFLDVSWK